MPVWAHAGATPEQVQRLDAALERLASIVDATVALVAGAGAAGGLGFGMIAFLKARLDPGFAIEAADVLV